MTGRVWRDKGFPGAQDFLTPAFWANQDELPPQTRVQQSNFPRPPRRVRSRVSWEHGSVTLRLLFFSYPFLLKL